jgi:hypothetical protein
MVAISGENFQEYISIEVRSVKRRELRCVMEQLLTRWDVFSVPQKFDGLNHKRLS